LVTSKTLSGGYLFVYLFSKDQILCNCKVKPFHLGQAHCPGIRGRSADLSSLFSSDAYPCRNHRAGGGPQDPAPSGENRSLTAWVRPGFVELRAYKPVFRNPDEPDAEIDLCPGCGRRLDLDTVTGDKRVAVNKAAEVVELNR